MRILILGATGTLGRPVAEALARQHEIVQVSHRKAAIQVDLTRPESILTMYREVGTIDAIVCAAGNAAFRPLDQLTDEDFRSSLADKLMGQVNVVRFGFDHVRDRGSITVTSGVLAQSPMPGSAAISLVNSGLEGFIRAAALEAPRGIRVNVVSPPWATETLKALGMSLPGGLPAEVIARAYVESVTGSATGQVITPKGVGVA